MFCKACGLDKPEESFYIKNKATGRRRTQCIPCHKAYYKERNSRPENIEARKRAWRKHNRFKLYGVTENDYLQMYNNQNGNCAICGTYYDLLYIDHCHHTGKVRGLLCNSCNVGIGQLKDNVEIVRRAYEYLRS